MQSTPEVKPSCCIKDTVVSGGMIFPMYYSITLKNFQFKQIHYRSGGIIGYWMSARNTWNHTGQKQIVLADLLAIITKRVRAFMHRICKAGP